MTKPLIALEGSDDPLWNKGLLFIKLRWLAFATALVLLALVSISGNLFDAGIKPLVIIVFVLGVSNFGFHIAHLNLHNGVRTPRKIKLYNTVFMAEIVADYTSVSILIFHLGFMMLNLGILFLPHVILTAIICQRGRTAFSVTMLALMITFTLTVLQADTVGLGLALTIAAYNAGIILFVFFLSSILVSEIVKRKNELAEINDLLVKMDREKQGYTLRATHELKAPFAAIQSYTDVILEGYLGEISPKMRSVMEKIRARCESLSKMIKNIIQLSNLRTTLFGTEDFKAVNAREFFDKNIASFEDRAKAEGKRIELILEAPDAIEITIIPNLFEILMNNLLTNGLNYSEADTKIVVTICFDEKNARVEISVQDNGIGIPSEALDRIFEDHYRSENALDINPSGNGMGLSIVKEAVRLHEGDIFVDSKEGVGTTFRVVLPIS